MSLYRINVCLTNFSGMTVSVDGESVLALAMQADTVPPAVPLFHCSNMSLGKPNCACQEERANPVEEESPVGQTTSVPKLDNSKRKWKVHELISEDLDNPALSSDQQEKLLSLLKEFHCVFSLEDGDRGETDVKKVTLTLAMHHQWCNASDASHLQCVRRWPSSSIKCRK